MSWERKLNDMTHLLCVRARVRACVCVRDRSSNINRSNMGKHLKFYLLFTCFIGFKISFDLWLESWSCWNATIALCSFLATFPLATCWFEVYLKNVLLFHQHLMLSTILDSWYRMLHLKSLTVPPFKHASFSPFPNTTLVFSSPLKFCPA